MNGELQGAALSGRKALAWGIHVFTASGAVFGMLALLATGMGELRQAVLYMLVALAIDAVDGTLARRIGVTTFAPRVDGRRLDDIVDYLNYVIVPAVFMVASGSLPHWTFAALPVLASAYGFSQVQAKTDDGFFLGFPSYWNVVAIYLWALQIQPVAAVVIVLGFALAVFVPIKYVYPSKMRRFGLATNVGGGLWTTAVAAAVAFPDALAPLRLIEFSLLYPAWYLGVSFALGGFARESG
jgi:phosphatidylcholine synthase